MKLTASEENYLKAIYKLFERTKERVTTNALANEFSIRPASVTDMMQRLSEKELIHYKKYKGASLTNTGVVTAKQLLRKHRLWEVFLVEKLNFTWDEVHEVAEQLEHIHSDKLVNELDKYLQHPKYDPHGDPIPDEKGKIQNRKKLSLSEMKVGDQGEVIGVEESNDDFLRYLDKIGITLGTGVTVTDIMEYDSSVQLLINESNQITVSHKVAENLWVSM